MRTTSVTLFALFISLFLFAQDPTPIVYEYSNKDMDISDVDMDGAKDHKFGEEISRKMVLFNERYIFIEPATPTSPTERTIVHKTVVYNSIKKIDRYLQKSVKKGLIDKETATKDLNSCLNVALVCSTSNTIELEKRLKAAKEPAKMIEVYKEVVLEQ